MTTFRAVLDRIDTFLTVCVLLALVWGVYHTMTSGWQFYLGRKPITVELPASVEIPQLIRRESIPAMDWGELANSWEHRIPAMFLKGSINHQMYERYLRENPNRKQF